MFDAIVRSLRRRSGVTVAAMFGAPGLRAGGKVFATLYKGDLVLKLPADRVRQLVRDGEGVPFDPGHGRVSREWIAVKPHAAERWPDLAQEAMRFVASQGEARRGRTAKAPRTPPPSRRPRRGATAR